jgi:hypothetical protein
LAYEGNGMRNNCPQCDGKLVWNKQYRNRVCEACSEKRGTPIMWSAMYLDGYYDRDENVYQTKGQKENEKTPD